MDLAAARVALAEAVTAGGLPCLPYPTDNPSPPLAWVDSLTGDFLTDTEFVGTFFMPGTIEASIVSLAQRNDLPGAVAYLEGLVSPVIEQLQAVPGLKVRGWVSGAISVGGQDLPAVTYRVLFNL